MNTRRKFKITYMGGNQAGIIGALTALSLGNDITAAVSYSNDLTYILHLLNIKTYDSIKNKQFIDKVKRSDMLLSVHGREIVKPDLLNASKLGAINIHPYLYKYKGANPVERALKDKEFKASVGAHIMVENVDEGEVLVEEFIDVYPSKNVEEVYNKLYPYYSIVILKAISAILKRYEKFNS